MDRWKYFAATHSDHVFCNPLSGAKVDELIELLRLPPGARVLDVACGKGELLCRTATRWKASGVGVDLSPFEVQNANAKLAERRLASRVKIVHGDGADYAGEPDSFDAVCCLGASWIWGGHAGTLEALTRFARPGGLVVVGEPYWRCEPSPEHLSSAALTRESFATHAGNVETGVGQGLTFLHSIVSSEDDWDRYEGLTWYAGETWAANHVDDPDARELLERTREERRTYLRWGRDELGWAVYLFRKRA